MMQGKEQIGCIFRGAKLSEFMPIAFWVCTTPVHWKYIYKLLQAGHPRSHKAAGLHQGAQSELPPSNQQGHVVNV